MKTGSITELKNAMELAKRAHDDVGQLQVIGPDCGLSYFDTHVVRVVKASPTIAKPAAALHDVLEDCGQAWRMKVLEQQEIGKLSDETVEAVILLTRIEGVSYWDYIQDICLASGLAGRIARAVKLADICDNLSTLPEGYKRERYIHALGNVAEAIDSRAESRMNFTSTLTSEKDQPKETHDS